MKKTILFLGLLIASIQLTVAQPTGYYNGSEGLKGDSLKSVLHNIIKGNIQYSYTDIWNILQQSDEDPSNPDNIMLIYTGRSQDKRYRDHGTDYDYAAHGYTLSDAWNREHVWAKSHGDFGTEVGAGTDAHNLKPVDRTVNTSRSNKDFAEGGTPDSEATGCNSTDSSWEPRDAIKGDVARIIFYMATRYEGDNGELDLEVVDKVNNYPLPEHGKLSDLLKWNEQDPPDDFERRRNNVIYIWQKNRNPFIDHPEFVNLIWGTDTTSNILISNIAISPIKPAPEDSITISADISCGSEPISASIGWNTSYEQVSSTLNMMEDAGTFTAKIPPQSAGAVLYYKIEASNGIDTVSSITYSFKVSEPFLGTLTSINEIQGHATASPFNGQIKSTSGIVTGVFGTSFYIQDGTGAWNGIYAYNTGYSPSLGDSIIITAKVSEYYDLTEISDFTYYNVVSSYNPLPEPVVVTTNTLATGNPDAEQYEGVLVKVKNATCSTELGAYGLWGVNDGSGECLIHNPSTLDFQPALGTSFDITGIATYNYSESKIDIRSLDDIVESQDVSAPTVSQVLVADGNSVRIDFNEKLNTTTATDTSNYIFNNNISISNISMAGFNNSSVKIDVTGMTVGDHNLIINGVEDLAGNAMDSVSVNFHSDYTLIDEINQTNTKIYPNPVSNNAFTVTNSKNIKSVEVFNSLGQIVYRNLTINKNKVSIDFANHNKGIYLVKVTLEDNSMSTNKLFVK